jgi:ABC-type glycerol-3-phosphate transport system substrate-binding protein
MKSKWILIVAITLVVAILSTAAVETAKTEVTEVEFFHTFWVPEMLKVIEDSIKAFEEQNPNIKVRETRVSWTDAPSQMMTSIMGGRPPDIVVCNPPMVSSLRGINALADMTDMIPEEMKNSFTKSAVEIATNQDGRWDGLPEEGCTWQLFYRKDLFEAAGLDPEKPPTTWEELVKYGKALTKDTDGDGSIDQWGYGWPVQAENANDYWVNYMMQAGSKVTTYDSENKVWVSQLTGNEAVTGTQFMVDLVRTHKISPAGLVDMDWEAVTNGFVMGNFAMIYNGAWVVGSIHQKGPDIEGKWGTALMVAGPGGKASRGYPNAFNILQASTKKEEAFKYLNFLYTAKTASGDLTFVEELCKAAGALLFTNAYIEYAKKNYEPLLLPFVDGAQYSVAPPMDPKWETFKALFVGKTVQSMLMGEVDVKAGLTDLDTRLTELHAMQ